MCSGCAGRKGTEANRTEQTFGMFRECVDTGEPFYCHESVARPDPEEGAFRDVEGMRYSMKPENQWRLCRAWMTSQIGRASKSEG